MCNTKGIIYHIIRLIKILVKEYFTNRKLEAHSNISKRKLEAHSDIPKNYPYCKISKSTEKKKKKKERKGKIKIKGEFLKNQSFRIPMFKYSLSLA